MRSKLAIFLARLAYAIDPDIDLFTQVIQKANEKQYAVFASNASILAKVISSENDERAELVRRFSRGEVEYIIARAKNLYELEKKNGQCDFELLHSETKANFIDTAIEMYLNEKIQS